MEIVASVILCTFNPDRTRMQRSIDALAQQTLSKQSWELIIVDNASDTPVSQSGFRIPDNARFIRELKPGLVYARLAGIHDARSPTIIFCDDDNAFGQTYLTNAVEVMTSHPQMGVAIGKSKPEFEVKPDAWMKEFFG